MLLSTQELTDLERVAQGFRDQVLGDIGLLLAHRQNVPESAELIARMIGTDTVWKYTQQTEHNVFLGTDRATEKGTRREVEEFRIHPNIIKELAHRPGRAAHQDPPLPGAHRRRRALAAATRREPCPLNPPR